MKSSASKMTERFIQIHLFMTSAKCEQDIKPIETNLNLVGSIQETANDFSLKLIPGRPDFDSVFLAFHYFLKVVQLFICLNSFCFLN